MENISVSEILSLLYEGINSVFVWFQTYIVGEWALLVFGTIFSYIFARLILSPLFGGRVRSGSSDSVKKQGDEE